MYSVGLDAHQSTFSLEVLDSNGALHRRLQVRGAWPKLMEVVDREVPKPFAVCFEASCGYGVLNDELARRAARVEVAHPGHLRLIYGSKRKNDRLDASKLAKLLHLDMVPKVHVPAAQVRQWRGMIEFRRRLMNKRTAAKAQLRNLLRHCGVTDLPKGSRLYTKAGLAELRQRKLAQLDAMRRDMLVHEIKEHDDQICRVEKELGKIAAKDGRVALLMTIPGIGIRTAEAYLAYVDDIRRFSRINKVGAYFGMVPCQNASAGRNHLGHINKEGPATVRWLICEAAWQAINASPTVWSFYNRIINNDPDRRKIAVVATAHYLLRVMAAMLRNGETWRESVKEEDLSPDAPPIMRKQQKLKTKAQQRQKREEKRLAALGQPDRMVIHDGAQVASQQSPILRVDD
jgi:transposase